MARATGTRSLKDLLAAGQLKAGEKLVLNRRSAPSVEAKLLADGTIELEGETYASPSGAAKAALDVGSVDGWLKWRVPRLSGRSIADIRDNG